MQINILFFEVGFGTRFSAESDEHVGRRFLARGWRQLSGGRRNGDRRLCKILFGLNFRPRAFDMLLLLIEHVFCGEGRE